MQVAERPVRLLENEFTVGLRWSHYSPIENLGVVTEWWKHHTWKDGCLDFWWDEFPRPVAKISKENGVLTCRIDGEIAGTTLCNPAVTRNFAQWIEGEDGERLCQEINNVCDAECLSLEGKIAVFLNVWLKRHGWSRQ